MDTTWHTMPTCPECNRVFSRREHLRRHLLIRTSPTRSVDTSDSGLDTSERPFTCALCQKSYARRDVFQKHLRVHDPKLINFGSQRRNAHRACDTCHKRKVKCRPAGESCLQCNSAGVACTFSQQHNSTTLISLPSGIDTTSMSEKQINCRQSMIQRPGHDAVETESPVIMSTSDGLVPSHVSSSTHAQVVTDPFMSWGYSSGYTTDPYLATFDGFPEMSMFTMNNNDCLEGTTTGYDMEPSNLLMGHLADWELEQAAKSSSSLSNPSSETNQDQGGNQSLLQRLRTAYTKLYEHSTLPYVSRPSSPRSVSMHEYFVQELGHLAPLTNDHLICDTFIGLFQTFIAPALFCFEEFHVDNQTSETLYLAMAAAGGSLCTLFGADLIATWLHHHARRKLLTQIYNERARHLQQEIDHLQTWVLSEISAFLSGNKRSVSLLDIYHVQLVQATRRCIGSSRTSGAVEVGLQKTLHTVDLLECYRIVFLQRPASFYSSSPLDWTTVSDNVPNSEGIGKPPDSIANFMMSLVNPTLSLARIDSLETSLQVLCALSLLISHGRRLFSVSAALIEGHDLEQSLNSSTCHQAFLELALQKWLSTHETPPLPSTMLLFHSIHLSMYLNFSNMERIARCHLSEQPCCDCSSETHVQRNEGHSRHSVSPCDAEAHATHALWQTSRKDSERATWHAERILSISLGLSKTSPPHVDGRIHLFSPVKTNANAEIIHGAHAVYYASLAIWTASDASDHERTSAVRKAIRFLGCSQSRVAAVFRQTLQSLLNRAEISR